MANHTANQSYLPNLNAIRFFAAATVVFYHIDNYLVFNGYKQTTLFFFPFQHGDLAVVAFFVLSGFLITYLLLVEIEKTNKVDVRKFYLKRVLRIWPLYFLIVVLAFTFLNTSTFFHIGGKSNIVDIGNNLGLSVALLCCIAPNIVLLYSTSLGYANPTWSIGVEEQFYLIWPWIVSSKHFTKYVLIIIIAVNILSHGFISRVVSSADGHGWLKNNSPIYSGLLYLDKFFTYSFSFRIDAMAIGSLGAYLVIKKSSLLETLYSKAFQWFIYAILVLLLLFPHVVDYQFYSLIFALVIVNLSTNPMTIIKLENPILNYLGKISYGIYIYHLITVIPTIKAICYIFNRPVNLPIEFLICLLSLLFSIAVASVSFNTFERFFLKIKSNL